MPGPTRRTNETKKTRLQSQPRTGQVIDLNAWKARRKARQRWPHQRRQLSLLEWTALLLAGLCGVFAIASCIPFTWQAQSILLTWSVALIGCIVSAVLSAQHHPFSRLIIRAFVICMAVSFAAAVVKLTV